MTTAVPRLRWIDVYHYEANNLRVHGRRSESSHEYRRYLQARVRDRLRKGSSRVQLSEYLEELNSTGFAINEIARIAETDPCPAPWEIGEVLAEVLLEDLENAYFPWPPSWDKRTATASLPGPDLIGFIGETGDERFVFGEVKTSNAADVLRSVIYGDDGLRHQVSRLVSSKERREILISWLVVRAQGKPWKSTLDRALKSYFGDPPSAVIVGVLLHSGDPDESHLRPVRTEVEAQSTPYGVFLLGFYLPLPVDEWPEAIEGTEDKP